MCFECPIASLVGFGFGFEPRPKSQKYLICTLPSIETQTKSIRTGRFWFSFLDPDKILRPKKELHKNAYTKSKIN